MKRALIGSLFVAVLVSSAPVFAQSTDTVQQNAYAPRTRAEVKAELIAAQKSGELDAIRTESYEAKSWETLQFDIHDKIWAHLTDRLGNLDGLDVAVEALEKMWKAGKRWREMPREESESSRPGAWAKRKRGKAAEGKWWLKRRCSPVPFPLFSSSAPSARY